MGDEGTNGGLDDLGRAGLACLAAGVSLQMKREMVGASKRSVTELAFERSSSGVLSEVSCEFI